MSQSSTVAENEGDVQHKSLMLQIALCMSAAMRFAILWHGCSRQTKLVVLMGDSYLSSKALGPIHLAVEHAALKMQPNRAICTDLKGGGEGRPPDHLVPATQGTVTEVEADACMSYASLPGSKHIVHQHIQFCYGHQADCCWEGP